MALLSDIQRSLMDGGELSSVLLKLKFLASRLGSTSLESWVQHEAEGYPRGAEVPDYRRTSVSYAANFSGPFGSGVKNAPIPGYLIKKFCGDHWQHHEERQSVGALDALLSANENGNFHIEASNLILLLQGNVYEHMACNSVTGTISRGAVVAILSTVRSRVLDLTIEIEKALPGARDIAAGWSPDPLEPKEASIVNNITNQIITGTGGSNVLNTGAGASIVVQQGDVGLLAKALTDAGLTKEDATEFAEIVASEKPTSAAEPFGPQAQSWLVKNLGKAASGVWTVGLGVATQVTAALVKQFYGMA